MNVRKKLLFLFAAMLLPSVARASIMYGDLDVRGGVVGGVRNLGPENLVLSLSGGTLKVQCVNAAGTIADCSATNPGWITLPSNTAGQTKNFKITTSATFGDSTAGDSDFVGTGTCSWGTTAATAWGQNMPLLLGYFHDGTNAHPVLARGPVLTSGASTNIGYQDVCPSSASQNNVIALTSTNVTSTHANKFRRNNSASQVLSAQNSDFLAGGRSVIGSLIYRAF